MTRTTMAATWGPTRYPYETRSSPRGPGNRTTWRQRRAWSFQVGTISLTFHLSPPPPTSHSLAHPSSHTYTGTHTPFLLPSPTPKHLYCSDPPSIPSPLSPTTHFHPPPPHTHTHTHTYTHCCIHTLPWHQNMTSMRLFRQASKICVWWEWTHPEYNFFWSDQTGLAKVACVLHTCVCFVCVCVCICCIFVRGWEVIGVLFIHSLLWFFLSSPWALWRSADHRTRVCHISQGG